MAKIVYLTMDANSDEGLKREHPGRYVNHETGIVIERSDKGGWNVINPETGRVLDNLPTLRRAKEIYEGYVT